MLLFDVHLPIVQHYDDVGAKSANLLKENILKNKENVGGCALHGDTLRVRAFILFQLRFHVLGAEGKGENSGNFSHIFALECFILGSQPVNVLNFLQYLLTVEHLNLLLAVHLLLRALHIVVVHGDIQQTHIAGFF